MSQEEQQSDYPFLKAPNSSAHIPDHLLEGLTPEMRYLIEQNSLQSQNMEWVIQAILDTNLQVRKTNGRVKKIEVWKSKMTHYGTIIIATFVVISSLAGGFYKLFEIFYNS